MFARFDEIHVAIALQNIKETKRYEQTYWMYNVKTVRLRICCSQHFSLMEKVAAK